MKGQGLLRKYDTFVFDWDGTLARVKLLMKLNEMLNPGWAYRKKRSMELIDKYSTKQPRDVNSLKGKEIRRHIRIKEAESGIPAVLADLSLYFLKPSLQNYSREALNKIKKNGADIALFTNGANFRISRELSYLGLQDYFTVMVSAQSLNTLKPNPLGLEIILKALHARKEKTLYVGDMVNDIEAAKYAGVHSCAIADGFSSFEKLAGAKPDYLFRSMEAFFKAL